MILRASRAQRSVDAKDYAAIGRTPDFAISRWLLHEGLTKRGEISCHEGPSGKSVTTTSPHCYTSRTPQVHRARRGSWRQRPEKTAGFAEQSTVATDRRSGRRYGFFFSGFSESQHQSGGRSIGTGHWAVSKGRPNQLGRLLVRAGSQAGLAISRGPIQNSRRERPRARGTDGKHRSSENLQDRSDPSCLMTVNWATERPAGLEASVGPGQWSPCRPRLTTGNDLRIQVQLTSTESRPASTLPAPLWNL